MPSRRNHHETLRRPPKTCVAFIPMRLPACSSPCEFTRYSCRVACLRARRLTKGNIRAGKRTGKGGSVILSAAKDLPPRAPNFGGSFAALRMTGCGGPCAVGREALQAAHAPSHQSPDRRRNHRPHPPPGCDDAGARQTRRHRRACDGA